MSDVEQRLSEIEERASVHAHFVGIYGRNDGGDDRAFLLALVRKYREALEECAEPKGAYRHDPLEHARNIIQETAAIARAALAYNPNESEAKK